MAIGPAAPAKPTTDPFRIMRLLLAVETYSGEYRVLLGSEGRKIFDSDSESGGCHPMDLAGLVSQGLQSIGSDVASIASIALNIGPGGRTHTRAGVAFANALAYGLKIPIHPFSYFEIVAIEAARMTGLPALIAVGDSNGCAYVGLSNGGLVEDMRFGPLEQVVREMGRNLTQVAVAGRVRQEIASTLDLPGVFDTGIERPDATVLLELGFTANARGDNVAAPVAPLNDQSGVFHD